MIMKIIDPHIHLFDLKEGDYHWLNELSEQQQQHIARSFTPCDMQLNDELYLAGFVHVEAGFDNQQPWREIEHVKGVLTQYNQHAYLKSGLSGHHHAMQFRSAGFANLSYDSKRFEDDVDKQSRFACCKSMRHILDDKSTHLLKDKRTLTNLQYLASKNLLFELQMKLSNTQMVNNFIDLLEDAPNLKVVLNHAGFAPLQEFSKPLIKSSSVQLDAWQNNISKLAKLPNISVKCSGWEMMQADYHKAEFRYRLILCIKHLAACFSDDRMMFASNFPLVLFTQEYADYWTYMIALGRDCELDLNKVCLDNAKRIYDFDDSLLN